MDYQRLETKSANRSRFSINFATRIWRHLLGQKITSPPLSSRNCDLGFPRPCGISMPFCFTNLIWHTCILAYQTKTMAKNPRCSLKPNLSYGNAKWWGCIEERLADPPCFCRILSGVKKWQRRRAGDFSVKVTCQQILNNNLGTSKDVGQPKFFRT